MRLAASLLAVSGLLVGCPRDEYHNIAVNETGAPMTLSFQLRHPDGPMGTPEVCGLLRQPNRLAPVSKAWTERRAFPQPIHWAPAEMQSLDEERCSVTVSVPAGYGVLVATDSWCADYREHAKARGLDLAGIRPQLLSLHVKTVQQDESFQGWAVAALFQRQKSGHCFFRVRRLAK